MSVRRIREGGMVNRPPHRLTFELGDEGMTWRWKVDTCPGPEHCKVWIEVDCRCNNECAACDQGYHDECEQYADENVIGLGPGCSLKESETCGLADWLENVGGEMIQGEIEMSVMAVHVWDDPEAPTFRMVAHG